MWTGLISGRFFSVSVYLIGCFYETNNLLFEFEHAIYVMLFNFRVIDADASRPAIDSIQLSGLITCRPLIDVEIALPSIFVFHLYVDDLLKPPTHATPRDLFWLGLFKKSDGEN